MAQQCGLGDVLVAGQQQHSAAVLAAGNADHRHFQIHGQSLGKPQRHGGASVQLLRLRVSDAGGIVPCVAVDQLSHIGVVVVQRLHAVQFAGRQIVLQKFRGQHRLIAVAGGGIDPRLRRGDGRTAQRAFQLTDLPLRFLDALLDLVLRNRGIVPLQDRALQRGQLLLGVAVLALRYGLAQRQDIGIDGGIQLQRRVRVKIGDQREGQLLLPQLQRLQPFHPGQRAAVGIGHGQRLALAYALPL